MTVRDPFRPTRRAVLGAMATGAAFFTTGGLFAEQLALTPSRTEGPFYSPIDDSRASHPEVETPA